MKEQNTIATAIFWLAICGAATLLLAIPAQDIYELRLLVAICFFCAARYFDSFDTRDCCADMIFYAGKCAHRGAGAFSNSQNALGENYIFTSLCLHCRRQ